MSAGIMRMGSSSPQGLITIDEVTSTLILRRAAILPLSVIHSVSFYQSTIYIHRNIFANLTILIISGRSRN